MNPEYVRPFCEQYGVKHRCPVKRLPGSYSKRLEHHALSGYAAKDWKSQALKCLKLTHKSVILLHILVKPKSRVNYYIVHTGTCECVNLFREPVQGLVHAARLWIGKHVSSAVTRRHRVDILTATAYVIHNMNPQLLNGHLSHGGAECVNTENFAAVTLLYGFCSLHKALHLFTLRANLSPRTGAARTYVHNVSLIHCVKGVTACRMKAVRRQVKDTHDHR